MKYYYGNVPRSQIIGNYKRVLDIIVVTFLDGSTCQFPYSTEIEQKLNHLMIAQASSRDTKENFKTLKHNRNFGSVAAAISGAATILGAFAFGMSGEMAMLIPTTAMTAMCIMLSRDSINDQEKLEDFKKYSLYLSALKNGRVDGEIDINSLDQYSLQEVQEKSVIYNKHLRYISK